MQANDQVTLSIIIGNYNTKDILKQNLFLLYSILTNIIFEIIVVDDNSKDDSAIMLKNEFPDVRIIKNNKNLGYSKSYNKGTKVAKGKYILHLNSDIIFPPDASLGKAIHYLDTHAKIGILGCKLVQLNKTFNLPCKRSFPNLWNVFFQTIGFAKLFPKNKIFGNYYLTYLDENKKHQVDCLMGAFMLIRKKVFETIGFLDERFFIYGEDIDFCYRAKQYGWEILYYPYIQAIHYHGATTRNAHWRHIWLFHLAMILYYQKYFANHYFLLVNYLVYFGVLLRFLAILSYGFVKFQIGKTIKLVKK